MKLIDALSLIRSNKPQTKTMIIKIVHGGIEKELVIKKSVETVQTMMIQGILDNTQDILLLKEGIEI